MLWVTEEMLDGFLNLVLNFESVHFSHNFMKYE